MSDFSEVERAMKEIENSAGSADAEMSIIQESWQYKINALKETWVGTFQSLVDRGVIGDIIDGLTNISEAIQSIVNNKAALAGMVSIIGGIASSVKGLDTYSFIKDIGNIRLGDKLTKTGNFFSGFFSGQDFSNINIASIIDVFEKLKTGAADAQQSFDALSDTEKSFIDNTDVGSTTVDQFSNALESMSDGANLAKIATNALINSLLIIGSQLLITGIIRISNKLANMAENTSEAAKSIRDEIQSAKDEADANLKTFDELSPRLEKLSKGVDDLGNNLSLTDKEYEEFKSLSQTIADMSPDLIQGYNDQGEAIVDLKDNVIELRKEYEKAQAAAYSLALSGKGENGKSNLKILNEDFLNTYNNPNWGGLVGLIGGGSYFRDLDTQTALELLYKIRDESDGTRRSYINILETFARLNPQYSLEEISTWFSKNVMDYDNPEKTIEMANTLIKGYEATKKNNLQQWKQDILIPLLKQEGSEYYDLTEEAQSAVSYILNNVDENFARNLAEQGPGSVVEWVQDQIDLVELLSHNILERYSKINVDTPFEDIQSLINEILKLPGFDSDNPLIIHLQEVIDKKHEKQDRVTNKLLGEAKGYDRRREDIYKSDDYQNWLNELTDSQMDLVLTATFDPQSFSKEDLDIYLKALQKEADNNAIQISTVVDAVDTFNNKIKPQFDELASAYDTIFHNEKGFKAGLESVDIAWFAGLKDSFTDLKETLGKDFDASNIETFFKAIENGGDITEEVAHGAFNDLATAYFYAADGLKDLNVATANSIKQMMKQAGITNADDIIDAYLTYTGKVGDANEKLREQLSKPIILGNLEAKDNKELKKLSEGGAVDLQLRPVIDAEELNKAGWDAGEGVATVFSSTFSNEAADKLENEGVAINFTPIIADEKGKYKGVLSPEELEDYAMGVIEGVHDDYLNLQIGATFTGSNAIAQAEEAANRIHQIHETYSDILSTNEYEETAKLINQVVRAEQEAAEASGLEKEISEQNATALREETDARIQKLGTMIKEVDASDEVRTALYLLMLQELALNGMTIETSADVQNLIDLAEQAGVTTEMLASLIKAKQILAQVESGSATGMRLLENGDYDWAMNFLDEVKNGTYKVDFQLETDYKKAVDAGSGAAKETVDEFEEALKNLQYLRDNDVITLKHYLDQEKKLIDNFYRAGKMSAEDYFKYIHDWLREMQELYKSVISDVTSLLQKEIDKLEKERDKEIKELEKQRDIELDALDEQIKAQEEKIKLKQKEIDELQEANEERKRELDLQKALYELERARNQRTLLQYQEGADGKGQLVYRPDESAIREKSEEVEEQKYQKRISILEKELDLLNEQRDTLEEQRQAIEDHYQELIDKTNEYYDKAIERIEEYMSRWEELAEIEERALMQSRLESLGLSIDDILALDEGAFESFKENYLGILADIYRENDSMTKALGENAGQISSYLEKMQPFFDGLEGIDLSTVTTAMQTVTSSLAPSLQTIADCMPNLRETANALGDTEANATGASGALETAGAKGTEAGANTEANFKGANDEIKNTTKSLTEDGEDSTSLGTGLDIIKEKSNTAIGSEEGTKGDFTKTGEAIKGATTGLNKFHDDLEDFTSKSYIFDIQIKTTGGLFPKLYGSGVGDFITSDDPFGKHLGGHYIAEFNGTVGNAFYNGYPGLRSSAPNALRSEFGQPELTVYPNGTYELTTTPTFADLPKDTVIFNEEQTKRILNNSKNSKFKGKSFANGSSPYLSLQDAMPDKAAMFAKFESNLQANLDKISNNIADITSNVRDITTAVTNRTINNNGGNTIHMGNINVTCPGITETEVARNLGSAIRSELNGMVSGMAIRANQIAMRR